MRVLVLGGSAFVGRNVVEAALERGHEVSIFNRGRTNPGLFPGAEHLAGDREGDLSPLEGRSFDAVFDTCGYVPRVVRASAELLAPRVERYVFVSSLAVYDDRPQLDEESPTLRLENPASEDVEGEYGPLKVACEAVVASTFPNRAILVRPGLIVGRYDYTGRFAYWPHRVARGGEVLAPGRPETRVWFIDARDLAFWMLGMAERELVGTFNATGPAEPVSMGGLLEACREVSAADASFTWVSDEFLEEHGVVAYSELPLWLPARDGYPEIDLGRAQAAGLSFCSLAETIRDALRLSGGYDERIVESTGRARPRAGLEREREADLLALWHRRAA